MNCRVENARMRGSTVCSHPSHRPKARDGKRALFGRDGALRKWVHVT